MHTAGAPLSVMASSCIDNVILEQAFWERTTPLQKAVHGFAAAWVCSNILFNYVMGIMTPPGTTCNISVEVRHFTFACGLQQC